MDATIVDEVVRDLRADDLVDQDAVARDVWEGVRVTRWLVLALLVGGVAGAFRGGPRIPEPAAVVDLSVADGVAAGGEGGTL